MKYRFQPIIEFEEHEGHPSGAFVEALAKFIYEFNKVMPIEPKDIVSAFIAVQMLLAKEGAEQKEE